jgi:hypothetical protein
VTVRRHGSSGWCAWGHTNDMGMEGRMMRSLIKEAWMITGRGIELIVIWSLVEK